MATVNQGQFIGTHTHVLKANALRQNRTYDYVYDPFYNLSSNIDHVKQTYQIKTGPDQVQMLPVYRTMFSELRHNPRFQLRLNTHDVLPQHVSREWPGKQNFEREKLIIHKLMTGDDNIQIPQKGVEPVFIDGKERYKFARRPVIPFLQSIPPYVVLDTTRLQALELKKQKELQSRPVTPFTKTIAIQTDYRDGEAQTDPYTPEYVVKPGTQPELLTLATLAYGRGLPAGLAEVEMIERARAKREWEKTLPPINDPSQWDKRLKMMFEMERKEWLMREQEIEKLQVIRMQILKHMLKDREENQANILAKRLDRLWTKKQKEKESKIRKLRYEHIKTIRKLIKKRKNVDGALQKRDIIGDYTKYESDVYAPITRNGCFLDKNSENYQVKSKYLDTFEGLLELEASLPPSVLQIQIQAPKRVVSTKDGYLKRKYREEKQLQDIQNNIVEARNKVKEPEPPLRFLKLIEKPIPRPPTPTIVPRDQDEEERELAIIFLQKLIRGKAIQNMASRNAFFKRLENQKWEKIGVAGNTNLILMHEGKEEKLVLINEVSSTHALQEVDQPATKEQRKQVVALQRQREIDEHKEEFVDQVLQSLEGEAASDMLDFLSKELIRLQEERRIHAFAMLAERQRRMREAEESGLRQVEERRRREEDEIFKQLLKTQQESVETYLQDCILESIDKVADENAREEVKSIANKINDVAYEYEDKMDALESKRIVADLVHGFLIPETQKQVFREQAKHQMKPYLKAAHEEIYHSTNEVIKQKDDN